MNVRAARALARQRLATYVMPADACDRAAGVDAAAAADRVGDADRIVALALAWPPARVLAFGEVALSHAQQTRLDSLLARRADGEPFAYLTGERDFHALTLTVSPAVLVPRPETELLIDIALAALPSTPLTLADCGTGSGAIALSLARQRPRWDIVAIDDCAAALAIAAANAARHALTVRLLHGDWTRSLAAAQLDAIVSNPPYVADGDPHLRPLRHEPRHALVAGADGLSAIRCLLADAPRALRRGGFIVLEHGCEQGAAVRDLLAERGFARIDTWPDLAGHERATSAWLP